MDWISQPVKIQSTRALLNWRGLLCAETGVHRLSRGAETHFISNLLFLMEAEVTGTKK